ncbi:glutamate mutase L, partial [Candidatus Bathyarchaeota archaeon]|nr:glutamate mutase L [Candidatus Bathyarchaeota archaeon]
ANLGMSYSICNVLEAAGIQNISRWIPFKIDDATLRNSLRNKMIRPTTIPQTIDELAIEQAVAREALRLGFVHHKSLARELRGLHREKFDMGFIGADERILMRESYIDLLKVDLIGGTGGLLSHAPRRVQSAIILMDAFQPEGVTELVQDSVFMMPHLGVLSTVHKEAAMEIFEKDCLVRIGTCIAPKSPPEGELKEGEVVKVKVNIPNGTAITEEVKLGEIKVIPLKTGEKADVEITPLKKFDVGAGPNRALKKQVNGGVVGIIIDARGRPTILPKDDEKRMKKLIEWFTSTKAYPESVLEKWKG